MCAKTATAQAIAQALVDRERLDQERINRNIVKILDAKDARIAQLEVPLLCSWVPDV